MENLGVAGMRVVPCVNSKYLCPSRVEFQQNGHKRFWDFVNVHDCVATLLLNTTRQAFVLVKQFRPALYMHVNSKELGIDATRVQSLCEGTPIKAPYHKGITYELCAGIIDQSRAEVEIARSECLEECGYDVPLDRFERVFAGSSVGTSGQKLIMYYAEVTDDMIVSVGGWNSRDAERIEVYYLPVSEANDFICNEELPKTSSVVAMLSWFFWQPQKGLVVNF